MPGLGLTLDLRLDPLALLMVTLVSGVGTLVFLYCAGYFAAGQAGLGRFAGVLTAFAGAMLGLVLADDLLLLYVFWELTSVTSWLLIGFDDESAESRRAAQQALLVTTLGGLVMLLGLVLLGAGGRHGVARRRSSPTRRAGTTVAVALVLVLVGAFTKSAQVPFHPWLPAAMAAPTPVSAYLHAAAMVKAGVYLVARLAPAFAVVAPVAAARAHRRARDDGRRRLARAAPDRPQAAARLRHGQPARLPHGAARRRHAARPRWPARRCCSRTALFKSTLFLVGRRRRPRHRHPRPAPAVRARPAHCRC